MDLWSLLSITAPGLFPDPDRFSEYYRRPIERSKDAIRLRQLRRRIRPVMLRRTKESVAAELPPKQEQVVEVELHPRHRRIYQTHLQRERQKVLGLIEDLDRNRFTVLRSLTIAAQAESGRGVGGRGSRRQCHRQRPTCCSRTSASSSAKATKPWSSVSSPPS